MAYAVFIFRVSFAKTLADCEIYNIAAAVAPAFWYNSWPCFYSSACFSERYQKDLAMETTGHL